MKLMPGEFRPVCINTGCNKLVAAQKKEVSGHRRWKPVCSHCSNAQRGAQEYADGVIPFRTGTCSNTESRLGFPCPTNHDLLPKGMFFTELDHIDGNHINNVQENVQELCVMCHKIKTRIYGEHSAYRG